MNKAFLAALVLCVGATLGSLAATATGIASRPGWVVLPTSHSYAALVERVKQAAGSQKLGVVTQASATAGAKKVLNLDIPGNTIIGLYHPRFAVRMLEASIAAGIEAPIRVYVTENADQTATLSYVMPSAVFAPYMDEGGNELKALATELDTVFDALAREAAAK